MIASVEHGFCFLHIPKCGGSSVYDQLGGIDTFGGSFRGSTDKVPGGVQQKAHLPLADIREHFPDVFEQIRPLEKIALIRDPESRFLSAFSQRAREVHGLNMDEMSDTAIRDDYYTIVAHLTERPRLPAYPFRHFIRQVEFTHIDGERVVEHLVPIERLPDLLDYLSERIGVPLERAFHSNKTVAFRHRALKGPLLRVKDRVKKHAPLGVYNRLKEAGLRVFTNQGVAPRARTILEEAGFPAFVAQHYAADQELRALAQTHNTLKVASHAH
ncbi:MAG: sulfotransferase family 2 domain-containing protein [Pseudomonadota bacterium]